MDQQGENQINTLLESREGGLQLQKNQESELNALGVS